VGDATNPSVPICGWARTALTLLPLFVAFAAAGVMYWPSLRSGFYHDDYIYLVASRDIPFGSYLHDSIVPGSTNATLHFQEAFWRPLYFLCFRGLYAIFGENPIGYHVVVFLIHLVGIAVVWLLAGRLTGNASAAGLASLVFAVYPLGYESVAWVSSLSSIGFTLALGSWLAFAQALEASTNGRRTALRASAFFLMLLSLGFRENALFIIPVVGAWYFCEVGLKRQADRAAWRDLAPYAALAAAYAGSRIAFASEWQTPHVVGWLIVSQAWDYLKLVSVPFVPLHSGWPDAARSAGATALLLLIATTLALRRLTTAVLLAGVIAAIAPFSLIAGVTPRYVYFPSAFLVLGLAALAVSLASRARPGAGLRWVAPWAYGTTLVVVAVAGAWLGRSRVDGWVEANPHAEQVWLDGLRRQYPALPRGSTLYVAGAPVAITLFNGVSLDAVVKLYYPQVASVVVLNLVHPDPSSPTPTAGDAVYIYQTAY
jgi:hypothetical protein